MTLKHSLTAITLCGMPLMANAGAKDDPLLSMVMVDEFSWVENEDDTYIFEGEAWFGYDLNKLWLKANIERHHGDTEEIELQALYSKAVAPYWDFQMGVRKDLLPNPDQHWAVIGFKGLAPYFFEIDSALFIGESGQTGLRFSAEYEMMLTQQWVLSPEIEANFYGKDDAERSIGSGLSDTEISLQLRYEVTPKFAPFIAISRNNSYGDTVNFLRAEGESANSTEYKIGFRAWF
ncbi:copper resistance protein B [Kangiella shandongensis]|uniref:copper resistance protein B n=1 Tax=Kangiella shandongensis TaxID=2763258 RepID=UPI001CBC2EAD|nr:copper resistance protein B [Kangiella shandongensis]